MDKKRELGPNMKKFLIRVIARNAIPPGGGLAAGIELIKNPAKMAETHRKALVWVDQAVELVRLAPDNPYGDDEEVIAEAILAQLKARESLNEEGQRHE